MRLMWLGINLFCGKSSSVFKKSRFGELTTEEIQEMTYNAIPVTTKKSVKFGMRIINGTYPFKFRLKAVKFQTEWLASPGGTNFSKPTEEMSKEELNVFFGRVFAPLRGIEMAHCQFTKVHQ